MNVSNLSTFEDLTNSCDIDYSGLAGVANISASSFITNMNPSPYAAIPKAEKGDSAMPEKPVTYSIPEIKHIVHNECKGTTTIHWADGTKTSVRIMEGDVYDKYAAFCAACCKKLFGSSTMAKRIRDRKDIVFIKAARQEEIRQREAAAAEKRAVQERREAKKIFKRVQREDRISAMVDEMFHKAQ